MKKQQTELYLSLIIIFLIAISCNNSKKTFIEDAVSDTSQNDDYALLRGVRNVPQRTAEDLSGSVIILTEKDFIERITAIDNPKGYQYLGQTPCIVSLYADWCKPCGYQTQLMNSMAPDYKGKVIFYKLNIDKAPLLKATFAIESIPTMFFFKPRGKITIHVGYINRDNLTKMIDEIILNP